MFLIPSILFILFLFNVFEEGDVAQDFHLKKAYHEPTKLSKNDVIQVAQLSDMTRFDKILSNILVPRVPGSDSHKKVKEYIITELRRLNWDVEKHESEQQTPLGKLPFTNIVARLNPKANRFLVLACHYDSKHMREGSFMGATDSAVPCAMMIDLAHALASRLDSYRQSELSLMLVFFDGEEAFVQWGPNDSIYGARSLAATWGTSSYPLHTSTTDNLDRIDLLVLLDLLGAPEPTFYSYFRESQKWYLQLVSVEKRLTDHQQLKKPDNNVYFIRMHLNAHIEDDHIPFIQKGVPCLHVIPTPFPEVWHRLEDNRNALDMDTIDNLNKIFRVFTLEYLQGSTRSVRKTQVQYDDL